MIRARYYCNVINPSTGYAQGRYADGSFLTDAGNAFSFTRFITEGAPCHYTWYAPMIYTDLWNVWAEKRKIHCQTGFHVQRTPLLARQRTLSSDSLHSSTMPDNLGKPNGRYVILWKQNI